MSFHSKKKIKQKTHVNQLTYKFLFVAKIHKHSFKMQLRILFEKKNYDDVSDCYSRDILSMRAVRLCTHVLNYWYLDIIASEQYEH